MLHFSWPGMYPLFLRMKDGGLLHPGCFNKNARLIVDATVAQDDPQWEIVGMDVNYESELVCDECGQPIESAY